MSLSANDNSGALRAPSGKTPPPPAPSAAYAKRARELHGGGSSTPDAASPIGTGGRYRPPALRAMGSGDIPLESSSPSLVEQSTLPPSTYGPGFRRARAGTLPSNVQLAAQRFAATSNTLSGMSDSVDSFSDQLHNNTISHHQQQQPIQQQQQPTGRPHSQSIAGLTAPPARPNLRHAQSIAAPAGGLTERNSRLRSGSLTLPAAPPLKNLSNAFGSSVFSSNWLGAGQGVSGGLSTIESMGSMDHDEFDPHAPVHTTLDYLGLDDGHRTATLSELRAQTQAALTNNIAPQSRMRASTVSNHYPRIHGASALLPTGGADDEDDLNLYEEFAQPSQPSYGRPRAESHAGLLGGDGYYPSSSASRGGYQQEGLLSPTQATNRPRAISVGILDDPAGRTLQHRSSMADQLNNAYMNDYNQPQYSQPGPNTSGGILKSDNKVLNHRPSVHFPQEEMDMRAQPTYLVAPHSQGRSISPTKVEPASSQIQTPTRSLWIGNLDSSVTSEQLIHVFAPYGAIESLRLLPEKECGFVNFVDMADAIRAKDDVLNRLGGNIGMPNGQTVRIGFGKADSAPVAPAKGINVTSPGPNTPVAGVGKGIGSASIGGIESQLQSSPTRALWIGSIPSTTTPAAILSVFSPYGPIESARVLTHKNCGFINFERLDDAVRARKALNGRDILGPDVGAIRIGFAKVPVKNGAENPNGEDAPPVAVGVGDLSVGATIHALRSVKGASTIPAEQQVLGGGVENYRSNLLLSMISSGQHSASFIMDGMTKQQARAPSVTEQMMIMKELSGGGPDAEADILALVDFRPPTMYYTSIPLVTERPTGRRWDASKLRELRKRMDTNIMTQDEIDQLATEFLDGEIVELASDWLGNTVVQKLFERCSPGPRFAMLERLCPHVAMIGIHKNGTWAAQKIIECVQTPEEIALVCQNLRPYGPPLLLDQFGNYVIQCCLRFGPPHNDFIFDAMVDRLWEVAQGRFGARSMRACLESAQITVSQQRRVATAIILNSIPLATNPNGALLLTWLLDTSGFPSRYKLLAPRFGPHLSHLCTHKLASLTVLRIINQKVEPEACSQIVEALFNSTNDHVLTDVLGDQVNGVAVVHKILTSPFLDPMQRPKYLEATKRVIIELKVIATQAYRRLIEEVGLPIPQFSASYPPNGQPPAQPKPPMKQPTSHGVPGLPSGYPSTDQGLASMMAALQMGGQNPHSGPPHLQIDPSFRPGQQTPTRSRPQPHTGTFSPASDPFNPFGARSPDMGMPRAPVPHRQNSSGPGAPPGMHPSASYGTPSPSLGQIGGMLGMDAQQSYPSPQQQSQMSPHVYQPYMYQQMYHQQSPPMGQYPQ